MKFYEQEVEFKNNKPNKEKLEYSLKHFYDDFDYGEDGQNYKSIKDANVAAPLTKGA